MCKSDCENYPVPSLKGIWTETLGIWRLWNGSEDRWYLCPKCADCAAGQTELLMKFKSFLCLQVWGVKMASMTSISVISTMRDKESFSTMSNMIDPETSVDNLVNHAAAHQKLGTVVPFSLFSHSSTTLIIFLLLQYGKVSILFASPD